MDFLTYNWQFLVNNAPYLSGIFFPAFITFLKKDIPGDKDRFILSVVAVVFWSFILKWDSLAYGDGKDFGLLLGTVFLESQAVYRLYFKDSIIEEKLELLFGSGYKQPDITINTDNLTQNY